MISMISILRKIILTVVSTPMVLKNSIVIAKTDLTAQDAKKSVI